MSCGCSNNINYPCGCGSSSCTSCSSTSCEQVIYTGPNLICSGINNDDNLCVALQKIDNTLCNPPSLSVTASNGLYKDLILNDIRMGGPLTEVTTIGTSNLNTLSITGLATDQNPLYVLVQTNLGVIRKTLTSVLTSNILAQLTANNGLTKTGTNIQLGGALIKPTTVTADPTNTLAISGLVSNPSATYIVSIDNSTGVLTKTLLSAIIPTTITADNGLTKTSNNVQLGGTLIKNTTVDLSGNTLSLVDGVGPNNGIRITPGAFTDCVGCAPNCNPYTAYDWTTNVNDFYSKNLFHSVSRFDGNVGIGTSPDSNSSTCGNGAALLVEKVRTSWNNTFSAGRGAAAAALTMQGALGTDTSNGEITSGLGGTLNFNPTTNTTLITNHSAVYAGVVGRISYGNAQNAGLLTTGQLAAFSSRSLFSDKDGVIAPSTNGPSLETYIGFQAESPQPYGTNYTGTLTNAIGVQIENQRTAMGSNNSQRLAGAGLLVNSYGIRQLGSLDYNEFAGMTYFAENVGIGTYPQPHTSPTVTSDSRLSVSKNTAFSNNPIAVSLENTLNMSGNLGSGGTSVYAANFGNLRWAPTTTTTVPTVGSIAGNSSYLSLASANNTTGGYLSSTAAQIYTAAADSVFITGVSSSGATITVPNTTNMASIQPGYQVILKSGGGNIGYLNTYVDTVNAGAFTFTIKRISGGSRGAWTYSSVTPSVPLSAASIVVAKANSGNDLGSIDIAIGARVLAPVADRYSGSSVRIDSVVGLQIEDQLSFIPSPNNPWSPSGDLTPGYISESYAIKQVGASDVNKFNAIVNMFPNLPVYANNAAAIAGGLSVGTVYRTSTGQLMIRY